MAEEIQPNYRSNLVEIIDRQLGPRHSAIRLGISLALYASGYIFDYGSLDGAIKGGAACSAGMNLSFLTRGLLRRYLDVYSQRF